MHLHHASKISLPISRTILLAPQTSWLMAKSQKNLSFEYWVIFYQWTILEEHKWSLHEPFLNKDEHFMKNSWAKMNMSRTVLEENRTRTLAEYVDPLVTSHVNKELTWWPSWLNWIYLKATISLYWPRRGQEASDMSSHRLTMWTYWSIKFTW